MIIQVKTEIEPLDANYGQIIGFKLKVTTVYLFGLPIYKHTIKSK